MNCLVCGSLGWGCVQTAALLSAGTTWRRENSIGWEGRLWGVRTRSHQPLRRATECHPELRRERWFLFVTPVTFEDRNHFEALVPRICRT